MSIPISFCLVSKASRGDEEAYQRLLHAMTANVACGHWTQFPCGHEPKCLSPTNEQQAALWIRLEADLCQAWQPETATDRLCGTDVICANDQPTHSSGGQHETQAKEASQAQ